MKLLCLFRHSSVDIAMTLVQPFNALVLRLLIISLVNTDKPEAKIYSCPVTQCSAPVLSGLPGRCETLKGEKGQAGTEI